MGWASKVQINSNPPCLLQERWRESNLLPDMSWYHTYLFVNFIIIFSLKGTFVFTQNFIFSSFLVIDFFLCLSFFLLKSFLTILFKINFHIKNWFPKKLSIRKNQDWCYTKNPTYKNSLTSNIKLENFILKQKYNLL